VEIASEARRVGECAVLIIVDAIQPLEFIARTGHELQIGTQSEHILEQSGVVVDARRRAADRPFAGIHTPIALVRVPSVDIIGDRRARKAAVADEIRRIDVGAEQEFVVESENQSIDHHRQRITGLVLVVVDVEAIVGDRVCRNCIAESVGPAVVGSEKRVRLGVLPFAVGEEILGVVREGDLARRLIDDMGGRHELRRDSSASPTL
jgi:hypothetical protein